VPPTAPPQNPVLERAIHGHVVRVPDSRPTSSTAGASDEYLAPIAPEAVLRGPARKYVKRTREHHLPPAADTRQNSRNTETQPARDSATDSAVTGTFASSRRAAGKTKKKIFFFPSKENGPHQACLRRTARDTAGTEVPARSGTRARVNPRDSLPRKRRDRDVKQAARSSGRALLGP